MKRLKKSEIIEQFVDDGMFDTTEDIPNIHQLRADAGCKLDHAYSHEITGSPVFRCADGKWYVGNVEFQIAPVNPKYLVDVLADAEHSECQNCGHIDQRGDLTEVEDHAERVEAGEENPAGECTKCGAVSHLITEARAMEIAGITKPKRQRRRGGLK